MKNNTWKIIVAAGGPSAVARAFDITPQAVRGWISRDCIPARAAGKIMELTGGTFTLAQIRPDVWG